MTTNLIEQARNWADIMQRQGYWSLSEHLRQLAAALEQRAEGVGELPPRPTIRIDKTDHPQQWFKWAEVEAFARAALAQQARPQRKITAWMNDSRGLFMDFDDGSREFYEVNITHEIPDDATPGGPQ